MPGAILAAQRAFGSAGRGALCDEAVGLSLLRSQCSQARAGIDNGGPRVLRRTKMCHIEVLPVLWCTRHPRPGRGSAIQGETAPESVREHESGKLILCTDGCMHIVVYQLASGRSVAAQRGGA